WVPVFVYKHSDWFNHHGPWPAPTLIHAPLLALLSCSSSTHVQPANRAIQTPPKVRPKTVMEVADPRQDPVDEGPVGAGRLQGVRDPIQAAPPPWASSWGTSRPTIR